MTARLKRYTYTPFMGLWMAGSAFTGGLFLILRGHVGPMRGVWGRWGALMGLHGVSCCYQRLSWPAMSAVAVSVCLLVGGVACLWLPAPHPPLPRALFTLSVILQQLSQNPAVSARW